MLRDIRRGAILITGVQIFHKESVKLSWDTQILVDVDALPKSPLVKVSAAVPQAAEVNSGDTVLLKPRAIGPAAMRHSLTQGALGRRQTERAQPLASLQEMRLNNCERDWR